MAVKFSAAKKQLNEVLEKGFNTERNDVFKDDGSYKSVAIVVPAVDHDAKTTARADDTHGDINMEAAFKSLDAVFLDTQNAFISLVDTVTKLVFHSVVLMVKFNGFEPVNYALVKIATLTDPKLKRGARLMYQALGFELDKGRVSYLANYAGVLKRAQGLIEAGVNVSNITLPKTKKETPAAVETSYTSKLSKHIEDTLQSQSEKLAKALKANDELESKVSKAKTDKERADAKVNLERAKLNTNKLRSAVNASDLVSFIVSKLPSEGLDYTTMQLLKDKIEELINALPELTK